MKYPLSPMSPGGPQEVDRMERFESLSDGGCECKYDILYIPNYWRKAIFGKLRRAIGQIRRDLCKKKQVEVLEGPAMLDHIHLCHGIPPKYSMASIVAFVRRKGAVRTHRALLKKRRMTGLNFWLRAIASAR